MKPLNGAEISTLALLAQAIHMTQAKKEQIAKTLDGSALEIAQILIGVIDPKDATVEGQNAAKGFQQWAQVAQVAQNQELVPLNKDALLNKPTEVAPSPVDAALAEFSEVQRVAERILSHRTDQNEYTAYTNAVRFVRLTAAHKKRIEEGGAL